MLKEFNKDRYFLERKYHNPDEPFNPFRRMQYHGIGYDESTGLDDEEILSGLKELEDELEALPHPVAKAKAVKFVLENERLYINEHDYFVGLYSLNRLVGTVTLDKWSVEADRLKDPALRSLMNDFNNSGAVAMWPDYDHVVPDWEALMKLGFAGIRKRAENYRLEREKNGRLTEEQKVFFEAIDIQYSAIIALIDRMYKTALDKKHGKAEKIALCLKNLRDGAPTDIYEAMQLIYIYFIVCECVDCYQVRSLGNGLDRTLYPFYEQDIKSGKYSRDEIKELLAYFLIQWSAIGNYWGQPFYLGGTDKSGKTRVNNLTRDIIEVYDALDIYNPKIQIKYSKSIPEDFLYKTLDMIRKNNRSIVFCCESGMIKAVMGYGATYGEALDMDIRGCYETGVRANEVSTGSAYVNSAKAVEYTFFNGFDRGLNKQVGIKTGEISEFNTFEDFYAAVLAQWSFLVEKSVEISRNFEKYLGLVNPSSMYSATVTESLKNARDGYQSGVKFNNSAILNCGFASLVDSVMAVKKAVFELKKASLEEMRSALESNWSGYEELRAEIKALPCKYGNGDPETDLYAHALAHYFADRVNNRPNARGGVYKAIMHSARQFIEQGEKTGALPDGRKSGEELSKNASPAIGADKNGVTALIASASKLDPSIYHESLCVDCMLHSSTAAGEKGIKAMKALLDAYYETDGMSIQFNVFNTDILREAQINPEKYKNLQVRVCGWNALWVNLSRKEQDAYIERAENIK